MSKNTEVVLPVLIVNTVLTHRGRVTHVCGIKSTLIDSDNGVSPGQHQAIIWTNAELLSIGTLGTNFSENLVLILEAVI